MDCAGYQVKKTKNKNKPKKHSAWFLLESRDTRKVFDLIGGQIEKMPLRERKSEICINLPSLTKQMITNYVASDKKIYYLTVVKVRSSKSALWG